MLERKRARSTWALGLMAILCTYNLAYANAKVSENSGPPPEKVRTATLNDDGATQPLLNDKSTSTVRPNKKDVSTLKDSKTAGTSCACSCSTKISRAAAAPGRWWDCMKGCLRSWGVSPIQLVLCGAVCGLGNIPLCAICIALDATAFMLCANGCAVYASNIEIPDEGHEPILVRKLPHNNGKKADRRVPASAARK